ncbi:MAG: universal stress protein [Polyangia bacterium]
MSDKRLKILVGVDFDDQSAAALYYALNIASKSGGELHLTHISKGKIAAPTDIGLNSPPEIGEGHEARERLERMRAMVGEQVPVHIHVRIGPTIETMLAVVRDVLPDFVVMGRHNRGRIAKMFLGSVSGRMASECPVPVLLAPLPGSEKNLEEPPGPPPAADEGMPAVGRAVADSTSDLSGVGSAGGTSGGVVRF